MQSLGSQIGRGGSLSLTPRDEAAMNKKRTTKVDKLVGARVELVRKIKNHSRQSIADKLEITHQQLQKYEKGENRITVGRLNQIAEVMEVDLIDLLPNEITKCESLFKGQTNSMAFYEWSRLSDKQKRNIIRIMRDMRGGK
jgi:transcriptional regulator with XRE-family HTH domain